MSLFTLHGLYAFSTLDAFMCYVNILLDLVWASMMAQMVKNPPAMQETQVRSLGEEDPLEKELATHSSILAWRILWT